MAQQEEIVLWIDRRWRVAIEKQLKGETLQEHLDNVLDELCKGDGSEEYFSYPLNAAEQEVLLRKMEEYCQKQTGMSLCDYSRQLREEQEQEQGFEPKMKM